MGDTTELAKCLERLLAGKADAKDELIRHSCERLRRLTSNKMLRNYPRLRRWEQTDDVLQNAMFRLRRSLDQVQPESVRQFFGLAATQIRRALIDLARHHFGPEGQGKNHYTDGNGAAADDVGGPIQNHPDETGEPDTLERWAEFHEAVQRLSDDEREVFNLIWYDGLSQMEAATVLGVTERTIRRRWHSARCTLHAQLKRPE